MCQILVQQSMSWELLQLVFFTFVGVNSMTTGSLRLTTWTSSIAADMMDPASLLLPFLTFSDGNKTSSGNTIKLICKSEKSDVQQKDKLWHYTSIFFVVDLNKVISKIHKSKLHWSVFTEFQKIWLKQPKSTIIKSIPLFKISNVKYTSLVRSVDHGTSLPGRQDQT